MTSREFRELRETFERLLELPADGRERELAALAARDSAMAAELRKMLAAHASESSLLEHPPAESMANSVTGGTRPALRTGSSFGAWSLDQELGRGGMGVVYLASRADGNFKKRVAIKILRRDRIDDFFLPRFHREREILAQLNHPHIASIVDAGTSAEGDPYFVMEYVDGIPITTYCAQRGLAARQRLELFLQVCDAVQHAHRNLTVHRDLKPSNILVTEAGAVKLLDFGIAKLLQPEAGQTAEAAATVAVLTPEYTSPEQIRNEPVTTQSDVFALGILLYEILAGEHPFLGRGRLPHEVMRAIAEDDPPPLRGELSGEVQSIVFTALRKDPAWRYPSVEQFAEDVGRHLRGLPVLARGGGWPYRLKKFVRRQWLPLAATAAVMAALAAGIVSTRRQAAAAEQARALEAQERQVAQQKQREAEDSRRAADEQRTVAEQQRSLAEARTKEAEAERQKERERYRDVRSLAASLLFELHDGIRDLAGSSTARRLMVEKAQKQLEMLNKDSQSDPGLQRDLAAAYEQMGELRFEPAQAGKPNEGSKAALDAYQHAVSLRRALAAKPGATAADQRDLALSLTKLGDGQFYTGDVKGGAGSYEQALKLIQPLQAAHPQDASMVRALGTVDFRRCTMLLTTGNTSAALAACKEGIETLEPLEKTSGQDVQAQSLIAGTETSYANALRMSGNPADAVKQGRAAMESLERLEALAPSNAEYRRLASTTGTVLAASLAATGDSAGSMEAFAKSVHSMEVAMEIDPSDLTGPLRLAVTLRIFSKRLAAAGNQTGAHEAWAEALRLLEGAVTRPTAGAIEWNEYADALLKAEFADLAKPETALSYAQRAVGATGRKNPFFLDTLAWAYFRTKDAAKAAETEREALVLVPADAKGGLHEELQQGLATFTQGQKF